jgi:hypothetical protein
MKVVRTFKAVDFEKDTSVIFKSEEFPVSSLLFSGLSAKFKREFAKRLTRVTIDTTADRDTVIEFVNACQLRECSITVHNALDLLSLAEDWEVPPLQDAVIEFIGRPEHTAALLIPSLCRALSRDLDTSLFETQLRSQIPSLLEGDSLLQLPLPVLSRLLTPDPDSDPGSPVDLRRLFGFLVRCLDHFRPAASVLFSGIRVDELTPDELSRLESHRSFRWCFVSDSVGTSLLNLMGESSKARHQLLSESESQSVQIRSLMSRVADLSSKFDRLTAELRGGLGSAESRFESSIRDYTASMDSKLEAGLENLNSEMNFQLEVRLREETESLKVGIESTIRNEIAGVNSTFQSAIDSQLSSAVSRFRTEFQAESATQSELAVRTLRSEIEKHILSVNSSLKVELENQCAIVSSTIRTELQGEREWVRKVMTVRHLPLGGSPLDGIISFLEHRAGGNVIVREIVTAGPGTDPRNAFDFHNLGSKYYHQTGNSEQWLAIDFKDMRIHVTDYSVQVHAHRTCGPKSWFLEGSDDGDTWFTLDTRTGRSQSQDTAHPSSFLVATPQLCRHLRFRKTEGWHDGTCDNFGLVAIEFFGWISGYP